MLVHVPLNRLFFFCVCDMDYLLNSYLLWIVHTYLYIIYLLTELREIFEFPVTVTNCFCGHLATWI